jgi:hypothetical protein
VLPVDWTAVKSKDGFQLFFRISGRLIMITGTLRKLLLLAEMTDEDGGHHSFPLAEAISRKSPHRVEIDIRHD